MAKYSATPEGVTALKTMSAALYSSIEQINTLADGLQAHMDGISELGPHRSSIEDVIAQIKQEVKDASAPVEEVCEALEDVAEGYQEVIDNDPYSGK